MGRTTPPAPTERQFQAAVVEAVRLCGWAVYHTWLSARSAPGFPDLVLARPPRLLFAELKRDGAGLTPAQTAWGALLAACPGVEYHVWRPGDWPAIERALQAGDALASPDGARNIEIGKAVKGGGRYNGNE